MILYSSMKDNSSKEVTLTGDWIFDGKGARSESSGTSVAMTLDQQQRHGISAYASFGLKIGTVPFTLRWSSFTLTCSVDGLLTLSRVASGNPYVSVALPVLGVTELSGLRIEVAPYLSGNVRQVFVNGFLALSLTGPSKGETNSGTNFVEVDGRGTTALNKPVTISEVYFKDGEPLRNWKIHDLKCVIDNIQGINRTDELKAYIDNDMRAQLSLVSDKPLTGQLTQLTVRTTVKAADKYRFSNLPVISNSKALAPIVQSTALVDGVTESSTFTDIDVESMGDFIVALSVGENPSFGHNTAHLEKQPQIIAQYPLKNNAYDSVTEVPAILHGATIAQALVTTVQDSYLECPTFIPNGDFTVESNFTMTAIGSGSIMENAGSETVWSLNCTNTLKFGADVGSWFELDTGVTLELGHEYHVAVVSSAGHIAVFVDGALVAQAPMYGQIINQQARTLVAEGYAGRTWDVRFCHSAEYIEDFEVQPLPEYVVADYDLDTRVEVKAQVEFLPEDTYEMLVRT